MGNKAPLPSNGILPEGRFMKLLALLLGMLVLAPLIEQFFHLLVLEDAFLTAVFIYAAYSISRNKFLLALAIGLALPAIASTWLKPFVKAQWFVISAGLFDVAFIATIAIAILTYIFRQKEVTATAAIENDRNPKAMEILMRMANYLAKAPSLRVTVLSRYDAIQADGEFIEFGDRRRFELQRPDRLCVEVERSDGDQGG